MRRRRWREYQTESGARPIRDVVDTMTDEEAADLAEAMKEVLHEGLCAARHLRGEIFEIRAGGSTRSFRLLFAPEGRHKQVLLALSVFSKTTQRTPVREIELAQQRLVNWRSRARTALHENIVSWPVRDFVGDIASTIRRG